MYLSNNLSLLLHVAGDFYKKTIFPRKYNLRKALALATKNDMLYYFALRGLKLIEKGKLKVDDETRKIMTHAKASGDFHFLKFKHSYMKVEDVLGENFLLFKTYKGYPRVCSDLDILVPNLLEAGNNFKRHGYQVVRTERYKLLVKNENLLPISIHSRVAWGDVFVLNEEILWNNFRKIRIQGLEVKVPSVEGDLLALIAHIPFELLKVTLGDLLCIYNFAIFADWNKIISQVYQNGWFWSFTYTIGIMNTLHRGLYREPSPMERYIPHIPKIKITFPYVYPLFAVCRAHMEKRAWSKILRFPFYIRIKLGM